MSVLFNPHCFAGVFFELFLPEREVLLTPFDKLVSQGLHRLTTQRWSGWKKQKENV